MRSYQFFVLVFLFVGCGSSEVARYSDASSHANDRYTSTVKSEAPSGPTSDADEAQAVDTHRHVIYDATIELVVNDFASFATTLPPIVASSGGYVADVKLAQKQDFETGASHRTGEWKVKVLSRQFNDFVQKLSEIGFVAKHDQTAEDVTAEFVDLDARIVNKKRMEARVLELITDAKRNLSEVMKLEKELSRIRGEIERMEGRLNLMKNRTEYATLTIHAIEKREPVTAEIPAFQDRVSSTWSESVTILSRCIQFMIVVIVAAFPWLVVILVLATIAYFAAQTFQRLVKIVCGNPQ